MSSIYRTPTEVIREDDKILRSETHIFISPILNKEQLPPVFKKSNNVLVDKKHDKMNTVITDTY
jgi:hypothetical protein